MGTNTFTAKLANLLNNQTVTENNADTFVSTKSAVLDFFYHAAASRADQMKVANLFRGAYSEYQALAIVAMFYLRDVRGGQQEKDSFFTCLEYIKSRHHHIYFALLPLIPEYGSWKDLIRHDWLFKDSLPVMKNALLKDMQAAKPSLLAKWLPSPNAGVAARAKAKQMMTVLGMSEAEYRRVLVGLRKKLNIVESKMSAHDWASINYEAVPSRANKLYADAFGRHDPDRYLEFLIKVEEGKAKMNASALFPHEIWVSQGQNAQALWQSLPKYAVSEKNALAIIDTSGSMDASVGGNVRARDVAYAMGAYLAGQNTSAFRGLCLTFSNRPHWIDIKDRTIKEAKAIFECYSEVANTNLIASFELILAHAQAHQVPAADMPAIIFIFSDMEFDSCVEGGTNFGVIRRRYKAAGYDLPKLVFWNLASRKQQTPVTRDQSGTALASGFSPSLLETLLTGELVSPYTLMLRKLESPRYDRVREVLNDK